MSSLVKFGVVILLISLLLFVYTLVKTNYISENIRTKFFYQDSGVSENIKSNLFSQDNITVQNNIELTTAEIIKPQVFNILMWTDKRTVPFEYLKNKSTIFVEEKCEYSNCFIDTSRNYLSDITQYHALIFHAPEFTYKVFKRFQKPDKRSPNQLYIFTCIESAHNYPVCSNEYDGFFNWTWTYRTTSEAKWGYVDIKDMEGAIIGPKAGMQWTTDMQDVTDQKTIDILNGKTKAVAWLVSNCYTKSRRESYAQELQKSLKQYNLQIDIYGQCGPNKCKNTEECHKFIKEDYHFYLSFENSIGEDYVTEKFLHALNNYAIPIVWGGADYGRFAPPLSYFNAREINAQEMAKIINDLMQNLTEYISYFKWRNYYKYQRDIETPDTRASCRLCKALNENYGKLDGSNTKYKDFRAWWNAGIPTKC